MRPSRIKTTKDAYDDGFDVGQRPIEVGWPSQADFDKRDAFVDAWLRGFSDGQKTPRGMPLWATNPPKRKTMKRRKYKRTARRGGRVMTVTTSSRVVKTTRMNPHGISLEPYKRQFPVDHGRYRVSISSSHSSKQIRKFMRELFPGWTKEQHADRYFRLWHELHYAKGLWGRFADRAHAESFPGKKRGFLDYKVSGVGRDEYPERIKTRLRAAARAESVIQSAIHAHELMVDQKTLKRAAKKYPVGHNWRSNPSSSAKITDAYRQTFFEHYLIAALWSSNDNSDESGGQPLDKNYGIEDIAPDSLEKLRRDCDRFIDKYASVLAALDADGRETAEQAGHDFWLTRNGHGAGFWDRGLGKIGDVLAKAVGWRTPFGEIDLYVGDDGKLHISGLERTKSNPRPSKTHIEFVIQGNYGYGWDDENTELTREDAKRSLREYRENGPGSYRLIRRRVKNDATNPKGRPSFEEAKRMYVHRFTLEHIPSWTQKPMADGSFYAPQYRSDREWYERTLFPGEPGGPSARSKHCQSSKPTWPLGQKLAAPYNGRSNPHDPRTADTVRIPAVIRASIPAGSGSDPRRAETRRLRVVRVAAARSNPARLALRLSRATWRRLPKSDRRARGSVRFVRCKTSKRGAAHWLRCVVR